MNQDNPDSGLACLCLLLGFLRIPADIAQLRHALGHGHPTSPGDLVRLAKELGVKARLRQVRTKDLPEAPLPAIVRLADDSFMLLAACRDGQALIQRPGAAPETLALSALEGLWTGETVYLATRSGLGGTARRFDVTWFIPALMRYRRLLGEVLAASLTLQLFALATPMIFQVVIDKVLVHRGASTLDVLAAALCAVILFEIALGGVRAWIFTHTTSRVDVELGARLYRHLLSLPMAWFEQRRVGDSVARARELDTIREFLTGSAVTLVIDLLFTAIFLIVLFLYSPALTGIVAGSTVLYAIISLALTPPLRRRIEERFQRGSESQSFLVESIAGVETLKAAAVEPQMQRRWEDLLAAYVRSGFQAASISIWGGQAISLVQKLTAALILYFGAKLAIGGAITVGELVAFNMLAGRVSEPVLRLAQLWQQFQEARVGIDRLGDILNAPSEAVSGPSRAALPAIQGEIRFDAVRFRYVPGGRETLRGIELTVHPGEMLGIVGPSGSGKSTLTKLVQRLYVPESGRVMVDGVDLSMVDPAWLRRQVGVVLQENILFNRSVRENIALADPAMPMDRVTSVAHMAGAHEFICELPQGYDTLIEERGGNLSGGQRQRIAIARALATDPCILIFDEATSALDAESEAVIQRNLAQITRGRTVLIIAHRLSAIRRCDRIVTLENGQITEMGDHDSLIRQGGRYASLWHQQMNGGEAI
jgi:ATP-binding cassette, subfamily B, bacterial HlyB/CyaB